MVLVQNNQTEFAIDTASIEASVQEFLLRLNLAQWSVSVVFVNEAESAEFNQRYRNKSGPTDILSFPFAQRNPDELPVADDDDMTDLGDLILCPQVIEKDCQDLQQDFAFRLNRLLAHGLAHLLGHDHETDAEHSKMLTVEEKLLGYRPED